MAWVKLPDLGQGLNLDASAEELPLGVASGGTNVRFRAGYAERFRGMQSVYTTPLVTPYAISHYTVGTTRYVVYQGLQKTYVDDGTTQTDITNGNRTGGIDDRWCPFAFNGVHIQNNGVDIPQYWGGTGTLTNLPAWPVGYKAGWMRPHKNQIVAGDITRGGVRERATVLFSDIADPGALPATWDIADPTASAGDQPLAETNGTLVDGLTLGDIFVIYKDDAIHYAQSVEGNQVYNFGRMRGDTGPLFRGCVVSVPMGHLYLTPGFDVVLFDGQNLESILHTRMRTWLAANINSARANRSFLAVNPATFEALVCFPDGASDTCTKALVWNWKENTFAIRDLSGVTYGSTGSVTVAGSATTWATSSATWATIAGSWGVTDYEANAPRLILTRSTPGLAMFDAGQTDYGNAYTSTVEWKQMAFDAPDQVKLVRAVRPVFDGTAGTQVSVQVGASMFPGASPTWSDPVTFTLGTDLDAYTFASGRYISVRAYSSAQAAWRIRSMQLDMVSGGRY